MSSVAKELAQLTVVKVYKDNREAKLGITFFRRDPQDNASPLSAIISRIGATGPAAGILNVGERIMTVQGVNVEGPLHAARMLRESEGYMKIGKLPKRPDFDENLERYQQIETEHARQAMASALPGQNPASTPRTDEKTPRGAGSSVPSHLQGGLRPLNQGGGSQQQLGLNINAIGDGFNSVGAQLSARAQEVEGTFAKLSARLGNQLTKIGNNIESVAELVPTQGNKEKRAAKKIQTAWRSCAARGHFHEERGAVLMLQSAQRRVRAKKALQYRKAMKYWAAVVIQERYRRYKLREKAKALEAVKAAEADATPKKSSGFGSKLVKSLSFSRRSTKKPAKPVMPDDIKQEDLDAAAALSARGNNPDKTPVMLGQPLAQTSGNEPTGAAPKKRSLSFTRRKKKEAGEGATQAV